MVPLAASVLSDDSFQPESCETVPRGLSQESANVLDGAQAKRHLNRATGTDPIRVSDLFDHTLKSQFGGARNALAIPDALSKSGNCCSAPARSASASSLLSCLIQINAKIEISAGLTETP